MPEEDTIFREVAETIRSVFPSVGAITAETSFLNDLHLDSLATMDLIMAVETRFDTIVPMDRIAEIQTVGDLVDLLSDGERASPGEAHAHAR